MQDPKLGSVVVPDGVCSVCLKPLSDVEKRHQVALIEYHRSAELLWKEKIARYPDVFSTMVLMGGESMTICTDCDAAARESISAYVRKQIEGADREVRNGVIETAISMVARLAAVFTAAWLGTTALNIGVVLALCMLLLLSVELLVLLLWRRGREAVVELAGNAAERSFKQSLRDLARTIKADAALILLAALLGLVAKVWWVSALAAFGVIGYYVACADLVQRWRRGAHWWCDTAGACEDSPDESDSNEEDER